MTKILIPEDLSPRAKEIFEENGFEVDVKVGISNDDLCDVIGDYHGMAIRSVTKVTPKVLAAAKNLKVVGRAGIGVDNVDLKAATAAGIVVMNTPHGNAVTTAEHALSMMFALARDIPEASASTHAGKWEKNRFMGTEVSGKILGVIGCGNIGSIVARKALGFGLKVVVHDPFLSDERAKDLGVNRLSLDELYAKADIITLHVPFTDQNRHMINKSTMQKMKKGVRIINCARGGLVQEADLKEMILSGHVAGAALDVLEVEPAKENILFGTPNIILTPHLGASTFEAQENVALQVAEQIVEFFKTGAVTNAVNAPSLSAKDAEKLRPYLQLVAILGQLIGQRLQGGIRAIEIAYEGEASRLPTRALSAHMLTHVLSGGIESINSVNALNVLAERQIPLKEMQSDLAKDYQTMVRLSVQTDQGQFDVAGTLVGAAMPRLVSIDGIALEAAIGSHMLFIRNADKPGLIGEVGSLLGKANVNIANFHLGRREQGTEALALIEMDEKISSELLTKMRALPSVMNAEALEFVL